MNRLWRWYGVCGAAIVIGCAAAFISAEVPAPDFLEDGHVVVNGIDYGRPGEKAFRRVVEAEGLVGSDEIATVGPKAYDEVRDVAQLYCSLRARHAEVSADDMVMLATEAYSERYARAKSATEAILRDAAASEAGKYWCPAGYIDASLTAPAKRLD
jgi:hypothetical protein